MALIASPRTPLADVAVLPPRNDGQREVVVCFAPHAGCIGRREGAWRTVLALDASRSMRRMFGGGVLDRGPNYVQSVARRLGATLAGASASGTVSMLYWALGAGDETQIIGEFDEAGCKSADISGPSGTKPDRWGRGTQLLPVIRYIAEEVDKDSERTMGVILTDGFIEDEEECRKYGMQVGRNLKRQHDAGNRRNGSLKLVLIGVGAEVDVAQLEGFDDMFEETDLEGEIDMFSHGVAASMKDESDILGVLFGELMGKEMTVAPDVSVLDGDGQEVASWSDGLPGKIRFALPAGSMSFTVRMPHGEVTQDISEAL